MSAGIHPSAVVEDGAEIGEGVEIGAFSTIGPDVQLGAGTKVHPHVVLGGHMRIGEQCEIFPFACLGMKTQDLKYQGDVSYVSIGNRTVIREYVTINLATESGGVTAVGSDCLIQSYCHIAHECVLGDYVIMSSGAMLAGHVEVGDAAVIAGYTGVVQFCRIGRMAMLGGYSKLTQDILPFTIAEGIPAHIRTVNRIRMERFAGFSGEQIRAVSKAYKAMIRSGKSLEDAISELRVEFPDDANVAEMIAFAESSERGLARPRAGE
jgi:UDP-N-acetylglucosamine acyltransferase